MHGAAACKQVRYNKHNVSRETYKRSSEKSGLLFCSERSGSGVDYECGIINYQQNRTEGGKIMSKIVNITSREDKDQKLQDIANSLEELKDVMAEVIDAYEEDHADSRKMDTLTEALDALEDAYEAVNDVLLDEL